MKTVISNTDLNGFRLLINANPAIQVSLVGTPKGFEVFLDDGKTRRQLFTQRSEPRRFKSASTAFALLQEMGVKCVVVDGIDHWRPDAYVALNRSRDSRPDRVKVSKMAAG